VEVPGWEVRQAAFEVCDDLLDDGVLALAASGRSRPRRTRSPVNASIPQSQRERRDQRDPGVANDPLIVELAPTPSKPTLSSCTTR